MSSTRRESIERMVALANRLNMIVVDMQVRKAQILARRDTSHKDKPAK